MAITIYEDKKTIKAILDTDEYIQRAGFKPEMIKTTKAGTEILNDTNAMLQIFISNGTPENLGSEIAKGIVYEISVVGKRANASRIENVVSQIIALLHNKDIGRSHILYLLDPPLEMESNNSVYNVRLTFLCQSTVYNKILK